MTAAPAYAQFALSTTLAMTLDDIKRALLASYDTDGGINHLDGTNLPSEESVNRLAVDFMHLLFPGFFDQRPLTKEEVPALTERRLADIATRLTTELEKSLRFNRDPQPAEHAREVAMKLLGELPALRHIIHTDVSAAYQGDPAARSIDEIILAYPCVLVISLQRIAHVLYQLGVPIVPRIITEYAHERTGCDIHPGAEIGTHFFIDHCTGVVIGETARIGDHVKIYQGVTLGAKSFEVDDDGNPIKGVKRHPDVEDHVTLYAHATILGGDARIGAHSIVAGNVWVLGQTVPPHSIVYNKGATLVVRPRRKKETVVVMLSSKDVREGDWVI
ncbi:MAG TPA: serine O-acetyltransferase [Opitutaceae bacterium]|nr:serine O-acetyltransferase [Opitutaceae bacterium]